MRQLVAELSAKGVTIYVMHDFDKSGFSILHTLRTDTRRWSYDVEPNVIDLGFRLDDVMGLETEDVYYKTEVDPRMNLIESGATQAEAEFLRSGGRPRAWTGKRVELNAMTSGQLVEWVERKLQAHGVTKVIPDERVLRNAFISAYRAAKIEQEVQRVTENFNEEIEVPDRLEDRIRELITGSPIAWDDALKDMASQNGLKGAQEG